MVSTHTPTRTGAPSSNGQPIRPSAEVRPPGSRIRVPEVAIGVLVTVVFALGAALWHLSAVEKVPALVAASPLERGEMIDASDVRVAYVSSDSTLARLDSSGMDRVVGRAALIDLAEGTLLSTSVVADVPAVDTGDGVVGLSLDPGAYPSRGLAPGDRVHVVRTEDVANLDAEPTVVARSATVFDVEGLPSDQILVSVLTDEADAEAVAAAAGAGGLRLVLVAP